MNKTHKVRIEASDNPFDSKVFLDGVELQRLTRVSFDLTGGEVTTMTFSIVGELQFDGEFSEQPVLDIRRTIDRAA